MAGTLTTARWLRDVEIDWTNVILGRSADGSGNLNARLGIYWRAREAESDNGPKPAN
jgi:hypothetical protein